jgi:hypothetical protein
MTPDKALILFIAPTLLLLGIIWARREASIAFRHLVATVRSEERNRWNELVLRKNSREENFRKIIEFVQFGDHSTIQNGEALRLIKKIRFNKIFGTVTGVLFIEYLLFLLFYHLAS